MLSATTQRGGAQIARYFSLIECDAGHALNDLLSKFWSVNTGVPAKVQPKIQILLTHLRQSSK